MGIPLRQALRVGLYILSQRARGIERFPLVLMLEPLFRCNLACPGCGKIQYPGEILRQNLSVDDCCAAAEECGAPIVSIAGGEPLLHPEIDAIVAGIERQRRYLYLCTNALVLRKHLDRFRPSRWLTFNVHVDGLEARHDAAVDRAGTFTEAVAAIQAAKQRGFRVTTNSTIFDGEDPAHVRAMLDYLTDLGVDGCTISPGYAYEKAPDQAHFPGRARTRELFSKILSGRKRWPLSHSRQYLDFLQGSRDYQCTPWGNPCRNVFGWQRPCYLFADGPDGYAATFRELMEETEWDGYGTGRHEKCANCMAHCGYEASAAMDATDGVATVFKGVRRALGRANDSRPKHWVPRPALALVAAPAPEVTRG